MRRRDFIAATGSAVASSIAWPLAARAQQARRVRRVGLLTPDTENDLRVRTAIAAFRDGLEKLGWVEGRNLRLDLRFGGADGDLFQAYAAELASLAPDVIVTGGQQATRAVQRQTQTIPIVIAAAGDVLANGLVRNIARPEGNTTGLTNRVDSLGGKSVELLKQAVPRVERLGLIYNAQLLPEDSSQFPPIEEAARVFSIQAIRIPYRNAVELVHGIDAFAAVPNGGLTILPPPESAADRKIILQLAAQRRLPAIYWDRSYVAEGGLMAYATDLKDLIRRSASYVDRILRGAMPGDLPVEYPTKFELVVNLKAAKVIGLTISESFLLRADEVIE